MEPILLPQSLERQEKRIVSANGTEIIWYQATRDTEKACVTLSSHLIILVLQGRKEMHSPFGKWSIGAGEGFFLKSGHYLMTEKVLHDRRFESLTFFFPNAVAASLSQLLPLPAVSGSEGADIFRIEPSGMLGVFAESMLHYMGAGGRGAEGAFLVDTKLRELFWILLQTSGGTNFARLLRDCNRPRQCGWKC